MKRSRQPGRRAPREESPKRREQDEEQDEGAERETDSPTENPSDERLSALKSELPTSPRPTEATDRSATVR
ncbi:MAG: hypothetical protein ACOC2N_07575 [Spirochaetota bacterium]